MERPMHWARAGTWCATDPDVIRIAVVAPAANLALLCLLAPGGLPAQVPELPPALPIELTSWEVLEATTAVQSPIDYALAPDGGLFVADYHTGEIVRLGPDGAHVWRIGGKGEGPGEFGMLYRLGVRPDGVVLAYDMGGNSISFFTPGGDFLERRQLDRFFRQVDTVLSPDSGAVLVSGIVSRRAHPELFEHGVHRFEPIEGELRHVRSFGPVPSAIAREKLEYWGAGQSRLVPSGRVLYAVRQPYDLYWFDPGGGGERRVEIDLPLKGTVDEAYEITRKGGRFRIRDTDQTITRPGLPHEIAPGLLLGIRHEDAVRHWDVLTDDGNVVATAEVPKTSGSPVAVVPDEGVIWLRATVALEPRIVRATYRLTRDAAAEEGP